MTKPAAEGDHQAKPEEELAAQFKMEKRIETKDDGRLLIYYEFVPLDHSRSSVDKL
jgi:hypothetical protein